jgi:hypothetical protein
MELVDAVSHDPHIDNNADENDNIDAAAIEEENAESESSFDDDAEVDCDGSESDHNGDGDKARVASTSAAPKPAEHGAVDGEMAVAVSVDTTAADAAPACKYCAKRRRLSAEGHESDTRDVCDSAASSCAVVQSQSQD